MLTSWKDYRYLETEPTARKFLCHQYQLQQIAHPDRHAFHQSNRFLYTIKQARAYYQAAQGADLLIKPLLLFYGCINLLKALLISQDPLYPQNTRMLQHGASTRKIKRNPYSLLEDEVRPQKEGLFSVLAIKFPLPIMSDRYTVHQLFSYLPEMHQDLNRLVEKRYWHKVSLGASHDRYVLTFPKVENGMLLYSSETFLDLLNRLLPEDIPARFEDKDLQDYSTSATKTVSFDPVLLPHLTRHPLFSKHAENLYFWNHSTDDPPLPKWATHYLLLYLLGMLCRYETAWWGELVLSHSYAEIYLVEQFLRTHEIEFPQYIWNHFE
ncbi:YaaC family protein [Brevibacillus ginsengisoli]|uniref:YaaC family protein n=1 Tax=Brevibacillus ginsengisoli TaxID=363854 RepID=UPI003CF6F960